MTQIIFDTRSPKEYEYSHIPGAISCPILDNIERHIVGLTYKKEGQSVAIKKGFEIFFPKFETFIDNILKNKDKKIIICCARGGLRSKIVVDLFKNKNRILELAKESKADIDFKSFEKKLDNLAKLEKERKIDISQYKGGYKEYRKVVLDELSHFKQNFKFITLYGLTCTRKTEILKKLDKEGYPVLDLEELAQHRASLFGGVGLIPRSQKMFENLLLEKLKELNKNKFVFVEGESQKIGKVLIPNNIFKEMHNKNTIKILIKDTIENRSKKTVQEYFDTEQKIAQIREIIPKLNVFLGNKATEDLLKQMDEKNYLFVSQYLLEKYYDIKYDLRNEKFDAEINTKDIEGFEYPYKKSQNPQKSTLNLCENGGYSKSSIHKLKEIYSKGTSEQS